MVQASISLWLLKPFPNECIHFACEIEVFARTVTYEDREYTFTSVETVPTTQSTINKK